MNCDRETTCHEEYFATLSEEERERLNALYPKGKARFARC